MFRGTRVEIDVVRLKENLLRLSRMNGEGAFFCPMVKANGYGHGDVVVAKVAEHAGATAVGVALVEEAERVRESGINLPILVFAPLSPDSASAILRYQLTPVVGRLEDLRVLVAAAGSDRSPLPVHLEFNTGMARLGFDNHEIPALKAYLRENPGLKVEGVCTHLSHGSEAHREDGPTARQLDLFSRMTRDFPGVRHAHKSSSLISLDVHDMHKDHDIGARPGIAVYGLPPDGPDPVRGFKPALRWVSHVARTHGVDVNRGVSYNSTWVATRPSLIGVVPVGYGDGYPRALSNRGEMLFRGRRVAVVGNVTMDYTLIDLTEVCADVSPRIDEEVVIVGEQEGEEVSAGWLAARAGTISYEIVTGIRQRVPREVVP